MCTHIYTCIQIYKYTCTYLYILSPRLNTSGDLQAWKNLRWQICTCLHIREDIISKNTFFSSIARKGGGGYPCPIFCTPFHQVKVPKITTFILKTNDICRLFYPYHQKYHYNYHNYHCNHYYIQWYFFPVILVVFTSGKRWPSCLNWREGGRGLAYSGNARKKTCFLKWCLPLDHSPIHKARPSDALNARKMNCRDGGAQPKQRNGWYRDGDNIIEHPMVYEVQQIRFLKTFINITTKHY